MTLVCIKSGNESLEFLIPSSRRTETQGTISIKITFSTNELRTKASFPSPAVASIITLGLGSPLMVLIKLLFLLSLSHFKKSQKIGLEVPESSFLR